MRLATSSLEILEIVGYAHVVAEGHNISHHDSTHEASSIQLMLDQLKSMQHKSWETS